VAAGVGFVMFGVCAALIKADMRRGSGMFNNLGATIVFYVIYYLVLPWLGWLLLRLLGVRPAWAVAFLGWFALWLMLGMYHDAQADALLPGTVWENGLKGALAYVFAATLATAVAAVLASRTGSRSDGSASDGFASDGPASGRRDGQRPGP
jgi:hypothetical protein